MRKLLIFLTILLSGSYALADEFLNADLSTRLPAAFTRFSPYADVAAKGGASAAGKFGSSINPAAVGWSFATPYDYGASVQYSNLDFDQDTQLHILSAASTLDMHSFGVIRFSYANIWSNDEYLRNQPALFAYDVNAGRLDWSKRFGAWSAGLGLGYAHSETTFRTAAGKLEVSRSLPVPRLGFLWEVHPRWLVGVVAEYGYGPTTRKTDVFAPSGTSEFRQHDILREVVIRPGVSWEWMPNALIQLDYQYARVWDRTGILELSRVQAGADLPLARFLFLRAGIALDDRGNIGWTTGLGFYPRKGFTLDLAYQNDNFPELQCELGHSRTLNASVSYQF